MRVVTTHPGQTSQNRRLWIFGGVFAVLGLGSYAMGAADTGTGAGDEYDARNICRQAVEDRLVSPASADFGSMDTNELMGSGTAYRVAGHVDAENRMGAAVRIEYECKAEHVSGTEWEIIDLQASER